MKKSTKNYKIGIIKREGARSVTLVEYVFRLLFFQFQITNFK